MTTQNELGRRFANGHRRGSASNVKIVETSEGTAIIGYGHAVYYERVDGEIVQYAGWRGYSKSTGAQLTRLWAGILGAGGSMRKSEKAKKVSELEL